MRTFIIRGVIFLVLVLVVLPPVVLASPQSGKTKPKHTSPQPAADPMAKAILGTWHISIPNESGGPPGNITVTFKADGTQNQIVEGNGHRVKVLAKYHVANGWLTQTLVRSEENGKLIAAPNGGTKKLKVRVKGDTLYLAAPDEGGTEMAFKKVRTP